MIEVAVTSRARDDAKARTYAQAGVGEHWILDVEAGELVVHTEPRAGGYAFLRRHLRGEQVQPPLPVAPLDVAGLLDA